MINEKISQTISAYLLLDKMQKGELAKRCNVQPSIVTRWISGDWNFTIETIEIIEKATGWKILSVVESDKKHECVSQGQKSY